MKGAIFSLAALLPLPALACSVCFGEGTFHLGLVLGTAFLLPLPVIIAWALVKAARRAESEGLDESQG